ncbi:MAG TPA: flagellar export chaperone FlgN [Fimbriimonadaceae bacterium]|nr:flagellar export chaperone FlgN [Fimbriimonadaceae bacterium]
MKTKELQKLWWDWLGTSERLLHSLYEQTAALTLRDANRVERIQPELDRMLERIQEIDEAAAVCAKELAEELGTESNLRSLVQALDKTEAQQVQQIANRVTVAAKNIQHVLDKNKALIQSELDYVGGTITLIAKVASEQNGKYGQTTHAAVLLDQAA